MPPAGHLLFLSRQEKKAKEGDPKSATPSRCEGANLRRCACGVRRGTRFALRAPLEQPRQARARSMRAPTRMPPLNHPAAGAATRGLKPPRAIAALGPERRRRFAPRVPGRAQRWPVWPFDGFPSGRAEKRSAGGGQACRRTRMLRALACRGCSSAARQRAVSSTAHPLREHRRLPPRAAWGSRTVGSPFFCLLFFGEAKKSESPAGATSRPLPFTKAPPPTIKKIADSATPISPTASQSHRNPPLPHVPLGLLHRVFAVVEDARRQHRVGTADLDAVGQVVQVAHAA